MTDGRKRDMRHSLTYPTNRTARFGWVYRLACRLGQRLAAFGTVGSVSSGRPAAVGADGAGWSDRCQLIRRPGALGLRRHRKGRAVPRGDGGSAPAFSVWPRPNGGRQRPSAKTPLPALPRPRPDLRPCPALAAASSRPSLSLGPSHSPSRARLRPQRHPSVPASSLGPSLTPQPDPVQPDPQYQPRSQPRPQPGPGPSTGADSSDDR